MSSLSETSQVCLLLGSNIAPEENLPRAIAILGQYVDVANVSLLWETPAVGSPGPSFLNAALMVRTHLKPEQLKSQVLSAVEAQLGRVRTADKYAPRPIDIDIVAWECQIIDSDVWHFAYAAVPVSEVLPCEIHSDNGESLAQLAARFLETAPIRLRGSLPLISLAGS